MRLGFEIPLNVFGKGLHIFHTGNIIINETSSVGEYCNIIGSTCLGSKDGGNGPTIGNHCELGMNSVVIGNVKIGNNVYIGAGAEEAVKDGEGWLSLDELKALVGE